MSVFTDMNFEQWASLAHDDPQAFEALRSRTIDDFFSHIPPGQHEQRLRCLQWRIDQIRDRSSNPMSACLHLYAMMWNSVVSRDGMLDALQGAGSRGPSDLPKARILDFPGPRHHSNA
ncbi:MAG: DUF3135 domain-containing protein [Granulosicoccaceae bacterium]|jgi:hypothetical protein